MDAIAFLMSAEAMVTPSPRGETPLPQTPFGMLVAAAANDKEEDVGDTTDGPSDMAGPSDIADPQTGLIAAIVSEWLAHREDSPSLPTFAPGIVDVRPSVVPEAALTPGPTEHGPAPSPEDRTSVDISNQKPEGVEPTAKNPAPLDAAPDHNPTAPRSASPDQSSKRAALRPDHEEPRISAHQQTVRAADIGWNISNSERLAPVEPTTPVYSEPVEGIAAKLQTPAPDTRVSTTRNEHVVESHPDLHPVKSTTSSEPSIHDEAKAPTAGQPKTAPAADRANVAKQSIPPQVLVHAPEWLQSTSNASGNPASPPSPTAENISISPPPTNMSAAVDSADIPVKLATATHEGQTAEMQTLALHIAARWVKGESKFAIRLDPPELGRIDVNLNVNGHGHAQAVLAVEKPQTLDLLLRDAPALERALKDAGLELEGNLSFSLKEHAQQNFGQGDKYSPPSRTVELMPTEAAKPHVPLNASLVEQLYGSRVARLDITV